MPIFFLRRTALLCWTAAVLALSAAPRLAADLTWDSTTGWKVEEGALSGLTGAQGRQALDLMNKARRDEEAGKIGSAIKGYDKVSSKFGSSVYAPEALFRSGKLLFKRKQYNKAFEQYQGVLRRYPNTKRFNELIGEQYRIATLLLDGAHNHMLGGLIPGFSNRTKGIQFLEVILLNAPYSDYAPLSLMEIARGYQRERSTEEAIDALDRLVNTYPQSVIAPVAYLKLGDLHASLSEGPMYDQASTKEAMTYYEDFMILYPGDSNVAVAATGVDRMKTILSKSKIYLGDFYFYKRSNYRAARVFYNEAITAYPESAPAALAKKRLAEVDAKMATNAIGAPKAPKKRFWLF
jgi:outer membrane protein assembly factor BamD